MLKKPQAPVTWDHNIAFEVINLKSVFNCYSTYVSNQVSLP